MIVSPEQKKHKEDQITRRHFLKEIGRMGLTVAALPLALQALLDFHQQAWAQNQKKPGAAPPIGKIVEAQYYEKLDNNKIKCNLCPNFHTYSPDDVSFCFTRVNHNGVLMTHAFNNPCTLNIEPIEKGPFYNYLPGTQTIGIGLGGCNLRCLYCQNWQTSMQRPEDVAKLDFTKEESAKWAKDKECKTICFTYTDPSVYPEYVKEVAAFVKTKGVRTLVCTAGFINPQPLKDICKVTSAFAVTLKAFNDKFYQKICGQNLPTILNSMEIIRAEKKHLELVNLIVPTYNDDLAVIREMCKWIRKSLGEDIPLHFGRFYPEYKLKDLPPTPVKIIESARKIAQDEGLKYVYTFNVAPHEGNNTYCPKCKNIVIKRLAFKILENKLNPIDQGKCGFCGYKLAGVWE